MRVLPYLAALALVACRDPGAAPSTSEPAPGTTSAPDVKPQAAQAHATAAPSMALLSIQAGRCAACHELGGDAGTALAAAPAPSLPALARQVDSQRAIHFAGDASTDVAAWLLSMAYDAREAAGPLEAAPIRAGMVARGEQLVRELGCAACHDDASLQLAEHTDHAHLTAALASRVAGPTQVAHVPLREAEAAAVAAYLLRDQLKEGQRGQGFAWRCFETDKGYGQWPDISSWTPKASGVTSEIGVGVATRGSNYLVEFTATIDVPATGEWTFAIVSDDGGWIWVDGEPLAANPGMHPATRKQGKVTLTQGAHDLRVGFTQGGGGAVLEVLWSGPGVAEQPIPAAAATTSVTSLVPPDLQRAALPAEQVARGRAAARAARCDACHHVGDPAFDALPAPAAAKPWQELPGSGSCSVAGVADLQAGAEVPAEVDAATRLRAALVADGCLTCHVRDGAGGLSEEVKATLVEVEDIGEEGVVPPDLTQVGRRLRPAWLERVVRDGHKARDYVRMRMPAFGDEKARQYAAWFAEVDAPGVTDEEPPFSEEAAERGRTLAGVGGRNCISCHRMAGRASLGPQGMDLSEQHERLRPEWFREWLLHPTALRPNTRMPTLWLRGDEQDVKDVDAIRTWLSLGKAAPLPKGIVVDRASMTLDPVDRPVLHGAFLQGVSARTLMVGTPQRTHFAFDLVEPRLVWLWRGAYVDATGTWVGRAGKLVKPLGDDWQVVEDFAVVADAPRRIVGQGRTKDGYPVLRVAVGDARYEDEARPRLASGGSRLVRTLRCTAGSMVVQFPESESYQVTVAGAPAGRHELAAGQQLEVVYQW